MNNDSSTHTDNQQAATYVGPQPPPLPVTGQAALNRLKAVFALVVAYLGNEVDAVTNRLARKLADEFEREHPSTARIATLTSGAAAMSAGGIFAYGSLMPVLLGIPFVLFGGFAVVKGVQVVIEASVEYFARLNEDAADLHKNN